MKAFKQHNTKIDFFEIYHGHIYEFKDLCGYFKRRIEWKQPTYCVLLRFWKDRTDKKKWLRAQPVGSNYVAEVIKDGWKAMKISGKGSREHLTRHRLGSTVIDPKQQWGGRCCLTEHWSCVSAIFKVVKEFARHNRASSVTGFSWRVKRWVTRCETLEKRHNLDFGKQSMKRNRESSAAPTRNNKPTLSVGPIDSVFPFGGVSANNLSIVINSFHSDQNQLIIQLI